MKKLFLIAVFAGGFSLANAQTGAGTIMLGGGLNFNTQSSKTAGVDNGSTTSFGIRPNVGYFLSDNLVVGLGLGFNSSTTKSPAAAGGTGEDEMINSDFSISPFVRYYSEIGDRAGAFLHGSVDIGSNKTKMTPAGGATAESTGSSIGVNISPGVYWFITKHIGLESTIGGIGFQSTKSKNAANVETKGSNFGLSLNTTLTVGLNYYIF